VEGTDGRLFNGITGYLIPRTDRLSPYEICTRLSESGAWRHHSFEIFVIIDSADMFWILWLEFTTVMVLTACFELSYLYLKLKHVNSSRRHHHTDRTSSRIHSAHNTVRRGKVRTLHSKTPTNSTTRASQYHISQSERSSRTANKTPS